MPKDRQFIGFDAYRKAIDCLRPGDVAMLTTHAAFRAPHLEYAVEKGVNVFMEKSFAGRSGRRAPGAPGGRGGKKEEPQNRCRADVPPLLRPRGHDPKIRDGAMGQIQLIRAYRMDPGWRMGPLDLRARTSYSGKSAARAVLMGLLWRSSSNT